MMAPGTAALLAVYTPIFRWLGIPSIPPLEPLQCRKAAAASQTLVVRLCRHVSSVRNEKRN
nr:hypothetical protein P5630_06210 [Bacillus subtilis]